MKSLSLSLSALVLFLLSPSLHALSISPIQEVDRALSMVGPGFVIQGQVTKVEPTRLDNGYSAVACTFEGEVLKGNEDCPAGEGNQTCVVKMVNTVRGLNICKEGTEGVFCVYGKGKYGGTSFAVNGSCNSYFETGPGGEKYIKANRFKFQNKNLANKMMQSLPTVGKALGGNGTSTGTTAAAPGTLSTDQVGSMYKYMIKEMYSK